jgi:uncharacterized membrane protein YbhN (UPF0104 family)
VRNTARLDFAAAMAAASSISALQALLILSMTAGSYLCLTGFDWLALRYVGHSLPYHQAAIASFTALSLGHNIGFAALSSGAVRYRLYTRWGLSGVEVAKLIVFCGATVGLGLITLGSGALIAMPALSGRVLGIRAGTSQLVGVACLMVPLAYVAMAAVRAEPIRMRRWKLTLPSVQLALAQVLLGTLNFALVAACLHQALNSLTEVPYPAAVTVYVLANAAAIASHIPGGLGVIEAAVILLLPGEGSLAAVILFRLAYYIVPLPFGLVALAISELISARKVNGWLHGRSTRSEVHQETDA